jgi:hypothetical protein
MKTADGRLASQLSESMANLRSARERGHEPRPQEPHPLHQSAVTRLTSLERTRIAHFRKMTATAEGVGADGVALSRRKQGFSPLRRANDFNILAVTTVEGFGNISNFSPIDPA